MLALIDFDGKDIIEALRKIGINISDNLAIIAPLIAVAVVLLLFIIKHIIKTHKWRKKQLDSLLVGYKKYTTLWQRWLYIRTWFQNDPPHEYEEPYQSQFRDLRTSSIDFFLKNVLKQSNDAPPYYCILGGSGMGKSTFVAQLVRKYINKYREKTLPFPLKLLYCGASAEGKDTLIERIDNIDNKGNTILILDALDENNDAIDNYGSFLEKLLDSIAIFRIVIITCRTQFFEKQEEELEKLKTRRNGEGQDSFKKYYVSPFTEEEVKKYLNKKFLIRFFAKRKARQIVDNCNKVMSRPLLLSYIDDLLKADIPEGKESIVNIYEILIDKWLEREAVFAVYGEKERKNYKQILLKFSNELASCMAQSSYDQSQMDSIIEKYDKLKIFKKKNLKSRSLLNRNSRNEYKFAHKSFMEYLVAKQLIDYHKQTVWFTKKGWFSLENVDCVSNDMIPLFLFYLISGFRSTVIAIGENKIDYSSSRYSQLYAMSTLERMIGIKGDYSDKIEKNTTAFLKTICNKNNNLWSVDIIIDCTYNYNGFENLINNLFFDNIKSVRYDKTAKAQIAIMNNGEQFFLPKIFIENYDFRDEKLADFIILLKRKIPCYFVINDYETILSASQSIVKQLIELDENDNPVPYLFVIDQTSITNEVDNTYLLFEQFSRFDLLTTRKHLLVELKELQEELQVVETYYGREHHSIIDLNNRIGKRYAYIGNCKMALQYAYCALQGIQSNLMIWWPTEQLYRRICADLFSNGEYNEVIDILENVLKKCSKIKERNRVATLEIGINDCIRLIKFVLEKKKYMKKKNKILYTLMELYLSN